MQKPITLNFKVQSIPQQKKKAMEQAVAFEQD